MKKLFKGLKFLYKMIAYLFLVFVLVGTYFVIKEMSFKEDPFTYLFMCYLFLTISMIPLAILYLIYKFKKENDRGHLEFDLIILFLFSFYYGIKYVYLDLSRKLV